ncbi:MAG: hypothetical protein HY717_06280 [Planctomycetes bacterium]|nr:hypothetical protein [Planctomycetota bacterium]
MAARNASALFLITAWAASGPLKDGADNGESFWNHDPAEALELARESGRWSVLFFPATAQQDLPLVPGSQLAWLVRRAVGAKVGAAEVKALRAEHRIDAFPAAVLVDPFGNALPALESEEALKDLWSQLQALDNRLKSLIADLDKKAAQAERSLAGGDFAAAHASSLEVLQRSRPGYPPRQRVEEVLKRLDEAADRALLKTLAQEGLIPDRELSRQLAGLAGRFPMKGMQERLRREKERLEDRHIGGGGKE